jgi:hypothetical protein
LFSTERILSRDKSRALSLPTLARLSAYQTQRTDATLKTIKKIQKVGKVSASQKLVNIDIVSKNFMGEERKSVWKYCVDD